MGRSVGRSFGSRFPPIKNDRIPSINPKTTPSTAVHKPITISCTCCCVCPPFWCLYFFKMIKPRPIHHHPRPPPRSAIRGQAEERDLRRHFGAAQRPLRGQRVRGQLGHRRLHPDEELPVGEPGAEARAQQRPRHRERCAKCDDDEFCVPVRLPTTIATARTASQPFRETRSTSYLTPPTHRPRRRLRVGGAGRLQLSRVRAPRRVRVLADADLPSARRRVRAAQLPRHGRVPLPLPHFPQRGGGGPLQGV